MTTSEPLAYRRGTDPEYGRLAAETFVLEDFGSALVLSGPCPRCGRPMEFPVVGRLFRGEDPGPAAPAPPEPDTARGRAVVMYCTVEDVRYEGGPEDAPGCGAYWSVTVLDGAGG
ncbi:hypothetical protein [Streptomyces tagetis]|uniref:Uncharacterized protein n=1 Tax=Streptomyces tagetis TaxID=2820809 RepID=A0A940XHM1_9ACTN|nr:hypothetical protein [Streptomyces sp. RG38]MBQ0826716.1 hypothetical protein [Streptomyces sp. RG38]